MLAPILGRKANNAVAKKKAITLAIDCTVPVDDEIMDIASFENFLTDKIKVDGKTGVLGDIKVGRNKSRVTSKSESSASVI